tara:strand:+ start:1322 stop:2701 length:1380 start_codon:yes stop_codon:yes gene_type:complete
MIEKKLIQNVKKNPKKIIFIHDNEKITYSEFLNYIFYFSKFLKKKINKKSKVLLLQNNCIEWAIHYFSIRLAGLTPVIISNVIPNHKLRAIINENKIRYVISDKKIRFKNLELIKNIKIKKNKDNNHYKFENKISGNEIIYTSGTTGIPKGVILKLKTSYQVAKMINNIVKVKKNAIELLSVPFFHSDGLGRLKCLVLNGHTMVINDKPNNFVNFFNLLEKYKINGFFMVSSGIEILKRLGFLNFNKIATNLEFIEIGSENIKKSTLNWAKKTFTKAKIYFHYGLTEASRSAFKVICHDKKTPKVFTTNKGINIDIIKNDRKCKKNEVGEIIIKGKNLFSGYINNNENLILKKSGFPTGDYAKKISDRSFELKGRVDNLRKINGHSVSLNEIQMVINMFPRIDQSRCTFVVDRNSGGYKIHARYTSKTSINQNKLIYFLRKRLETFKIPNRFTRIKQIS